MIQPLCSNTANDLALSLPASCPIISPGDELADLVGPLGKATDIRNYGTVVLACGGVGAAPTLPIAQAMKAAGNRVITVLAARNKDLIILKDELAQYSDERFM